MAPSSFKFKHVAIEWLLVLLVLGCNLFYFHLYQKKGTTISIISTYKIDTKHLVVVGEVKASLFFFSWCLLIMSTFDTQIKLLFKIYYISYVEILNSYTKLYFSGLNSFFFFFFIHHLYLFFHYVPLYIYIYIYFNLILHFTNHLPM